MDCKMSYISPFGKMLLSADAEGLTGVWFVGQKYFASRLQDAQDLSVLNAADNPDASTVAHFPAVLNDFDDTASNLVNVSSNFGDASNSVVQTSSIQANATQSSAVQALRMAKRWLDEYFTGIEPTVQVPLHLVGTDFQNEVWEILQTIPYGKTITYGDIAKQIAAKRGIARMSSQAVGGAVGHNPVSIIVPCHRVVGSNGNLTGYAGGIDKKVALLTLEGLDMSAFSMPTKGTVS